MGNIRIYSKLKSGKVNFQGSRVRNKEIGSLTVNAHPNVAFSDRIQIKSNKIFKRNSTTQYRVFFRRLNINRIENEAGEQLTAAPYNYDRDAIIAYVQGQITKPIITEYFEYDPISDRLVAQKDIQVDKSGFFLGEKHKIASGNSNIYFEDLDNKANSYPVFGEVLDQSLAANQVAGQGVTKPKSRIFGDFQSVPLGGVPVSGTSIPYDGDNFFSFNISGVGITTRSAEAIPASQQLKYEILVNGISVYVQFLEHGGIAVDEDITWYFEHPLDIEAGTTLRATIYKVEVIGNEETIQGILNVCEGDASATRYQTNVLNRFFVDEEIALKTDVDALLSGSTYKGSYNGATSFPSLPTGTDVLGDFYRVTAAGGGYATGDILVFNGTDYDHIAESSATQSDIKNSALKVHDIYVKAGYVGAVKDGSILYPYSDLTTAVGSANDKDSIYLEGTFEIASEITLPSDKSLFFYGSDDAVVKFTNYSASNGSLFYFNGTDSTKELKFTNITFKNAGEYGLYTKKTAKVEINDCLFENNGWNGTALNTIVASNISGLLGYDSTAADLQAFYAGSNASNGGAMRIEESTKLLVIGNTVEKNLRGIRVQDCGIGGAGVISRNQSSQNIESGIYVAAGSLGGSQNITVMMNVSAYNANNGLLVIGGLNNKFSQNEVSGNWNAGFCAWGAGNTTLRDSGLYDNNRSEFNGIGNTGDAKASIQINEAYNLLGTNISINPAFHFIAEILDTQVHYTGLGSNTEKIGFLITQQVGLLMSNDKNIIRVDDVGFIGQDYAIDFSEVDLSTLNVSLGDNSYMSIGEKAIKSPLAGDFFELPFSNHITNINYADISVDLTGNVIIKEGPSGNKLNPYKVNDLQAVAFGTKIKVILKGSDKIQFIVPVAGCSIDGSFVNSVLNQAVTQINDVFTNTSGFASGGGNPVNSFVLSGDDLTIGLEDGTSFTVDVTSLGVDTDKFVSSGALSGSNLILTMNDSTEVTIDATNMINGSTGLATESGWFISYGANANTAVATSINDSTINQQLPFYFGEALEQGSEFKWNFQSNGGTNLILGIWDGAESPIAYNGGSLTHSNWGTMFAYAGGFTDGSNSELLTTNSGAKYVVSNGDAMGIRFGNDGHLTLIDYSGTNEVAVAKTTIPLAVTSFNMQMHTWANGVLPNGIINNVDYIWDIVHDFANTEAGIINGILDHTVIKSAISIEIGEKIMFMLDEIGRGDFFGTNYTNASTGVSTAEEQLDNTFVYQTNEALVFTQGGANDWDMNTNASGYFFAANLDQYREGGGSGTIQGMFSLRFNTDGKLTIYDEDAGIKIATAKMDPAVGSSVHLYYGVKANRNYSSIPVISKQSLSGGSQPNVNFVPTVADQTASVEEGEVLNYQIISSNNIVNQFVQSDAPSWMFLNQATGVLSGTAPPFLGTSSDTIIVNCKAGNAVGGTVDFTVTITITETVASFSNTKSLNFDGTSGYLSGNPLNMNAMDRATNGDGNTWTVSMWFKPSSSSSTQTLFNYGEALATNAGAITIQQHGGNHVLVTYGTTSNKLVLIALGSLGVGVWNNLVVTFDGGTTGVLSGDINSYYSRFKIYVNGVQKPAAGSHSNYGYSGALNGNNTSNNIFRIGRDNNAYNNYAETVINQVAIWDSAMDADVTALWNSGVAQDLTSFSTVPSHLYNVESSILTVSDEIGNADLTGYNFVSGDLVTDAPN